MIRIWAIAACLSAGGIPPRDYDQLVAAEAEKRAQRDEAKAAAHRALDAGDYEKAVERARRARELDGEIDRIRRESRERLRDEVRELVGRLDDDDYEVRESASRRLRARGSAAFPELLRIRPGVASLECRCRLGELLRGLTLDGMGRLHQWAVDAVASSEYGTGDWSAKQAIGPPDTFEAGDSRTAWAAREADAGTEWLRLSYAVTTRIRKIRVLENSAPGGIVAIDVIGPDGARRRVWEGTDPGGAGMIWFEADLKGAMGREVVLVLDTKKNSGWEEIDAVELVGDLTED